jgi:hypothetical protein
MTKQEKLKDFHITDPLDKILFDEHDRPYVVLYHEGQEFGHWYLSRKTPYYYTIKN